MFNWDTVKEYVEVVFIALIIALVIRTLIVQAFKIPSGSMLDTLQIGDHILVNKFIYWFTPIKRGDIIVFKYPLNPKIDFVKRVIGLPGDTIKIKDKQVFVNAQKLKELYVNRSDSRDTAAEEDNFGPIVVPQDNYFVMGDNRDESRDSRFWGFLPAKLIKGNTFFIYWPLSRFGRINQSGGK